MSRKKSKTKKPRKTAAQREAEDAAIILMQAEAHTQTVREAAAAPMKIIRAARTIKAARVLILSGKTAYESWVREAGFAKDARIMEYEKLPVHMHTRWEQIAADVFKAMGGVALAEKAARWDALMSSQRMHIVGCTGFEIKMIDPKGPNIIENKTARIRPDAQLHFGMEFWNEHPAAGNPRFPDKFERELLIAYVDAIRERKK